MAANTALKVEERREYRRVSDAVGLQLQKQDTDAHVEQQAFDETEAPTHPTHVVSLSPNGLRCYLDEPLVNGDAVSLQLTLFPEHESLQLDGEIVNAGEDKGSTRTNRFFAGIAFRNIGKQQSEILLTHIDGVAKKSFGGAIKLINKR